MKTDLHVLLSAYQCGPGMGSVSQIGWEWYKRLAVRARVTLVTHSRNREALEKAGCPLENSEVIYVDTEWFAGPLYRLASRLFPRSQHSVFLLSSLDYFVFDWQAVRRLRRRRRAGDSWDVAHVVTPVSPVAANTVHRLGCPVILGPWNGGLQSPRTFPEIMREDSGWVYRFRSLGSILDAIGGCTRRASLILSATLATDESIPRAVRNRCHRMLENGVDLDLFHAAPWPPCPGTDQPLRVLFVGRLIPVKGVPMLLEAVARVRSEILIEVVIAGDGPCRAAWESEAARLGLGGTVRFLGNLPLAEVAAEMAKAHLFCLPCVRESGGAVLLEAMAAARPVAAVLYGGPAEIVDPGVGQGIAPEGVDAVVTGLVGAFRDVVRRPEEWRRRGVEGRRRAEQQFSWDAKVEFTLDLYRQLVEGRI